MTEDPRLPCATPIADPTISSSYQHFSMDDSYNEESIVTDASQRAARRTLLNFVLMSILFSANHGCVVACLALATARLGAIGAWQSGILYLTYTLSAVLGATWIVKKMGARNALWLGMALYCAYVGCFWIATRMEAIDDQRLAAYLGAAIGGVGAGFLWTAQGSYFGRAAEEHADHLQQPLSTSTASLAGIFAFFYLSEEVLLRSLSTVLVGILSWEAIFGLYTLVTLLSTLAMPLVHNYPSSDDEEEEEAGNTGAAESTNSVFYKVTVAGQLLRNDPKMKYMIGLNAVFGFTAAFLNSYVNGQVVPVALNDPDSRYIGVLSSWVSAVAAGMSLVFGRIAPTSGKGPILLLGAACFFAVVFPFLVVPDANQYGWFMLVLVYTFHGVGRATFEGTLKATFADFFAYEKEGAFANIILQNGLSGAIGYVLTFALLCDTPSRYCIEYSNGTLHDVLTFELIAVLSAILAVLGYLRASVLHRSEEEAQRIATDSEETNASGIVDDEAEHREVVAPLLESDANIPSQA